MPQSRPRLPLLIFTHLALQNRAEEEGDDDGDEHPGAGVALPQAGVLLEVAPQQLLGLPVQRSRSFL